MALDTLERRLCDLERRVFGPDAGAHSSQPTPTGGAAQALDSLARSLGNAMERRGDRLAPMLRRTQELEKFLDPSFLEGISGAAEGGLDADEKADVVLAREDEIRKAAAVAERLKALQSVLDGDQFESALRLEPKVKELTRLQIDQAEQEAKLSEETLALIGKYNETIDALSKSFVYYDLVLKDAEERAKPKPAQD